MKQQRGGARLWLSLLLVVVLAFCHSGVHTGTNAEVSIQTESVVGYVNIISCWYACQSDMSANAVVYLTQTVLQKRADFVHR